jgi:hypothetical protein
VEYLRKATKFEPASPEYRPEALSIEPTYTGIYSNILKKIPDYFHIIFALTKSHEWLIKFDVEGSLSLMKDPYGINSVESVSFAVA